MAEPSSSVRLFYGPDRWPLERTATATEKSHGYRPFHGIVSLGLRAHAACTPERWHSAAPRLDTRSPHEAIVRAASECGALSFDESLAAALHAATSYQEGGSLMELWHFKEGHTASVWCATFQRDRDGAVCRIVFNVARDDAASSALEAVGSQFRELGERLPHIAAAHVLARWTLRRPTGLGAPVTVVAQAFVEDALEIHAVPTTNRGQRLVAVERFLTAPQEPARIEAVRGHPLTLEEHARVGADMASLLLVGARRQASHGWSLPTFTVNNGDWVWCVDRAVAISCGPTPRFADARDVSDAVHAALRAVCEHLDDQLAAAVHNGAHSVLKEAGERS